MTIKIGVDQVKRGMYVAQLDRPWLNTSFLFQGFLVNTTDEINKLRETCHFVYIDEEKSKIKIAPKLKISLLTNDVANRNSPRKAKHVYAQEAQSLLETELRLARKLHDETRSYIKDVLEDVRLGRSINTNNAKQLVSALANSVVRNPSALLWLSHLKQRDEYTAIHSVNVCILALSFGRSLGLPKDELNKLGLGALLHDIGKMAVPLEILNKPGKLNEQEFLILKTHPMLGYDLLKSKNSLPEFLLEVVKHHHEREGGGGYPNGLYGHQLNQYTKIVTIVDVYDAITSDRVYHDAVTPFSALNNMYKWDFDQELFNGFIKCLGIYPVGSLVELNTGEVGVVASSAERNRLRPTVLLILDKDKSPYDLPKMVNLSSAAWSHGAQHIEIKRVLDNQTYNIDVKKIIARDIA